MLAPLKWLEDYVDLSLSDQEIAHRLTMAGLEVTSIERVGESWDDISVGRVLEVERHPNADRLTLVTVDDGELSLQSGVRGTQRSGRTEDRLCEGWGASH